MRLRSLKSIFRHENVVSTVLTASARDQGGGGGHLLAEWGPSKSVNRSTLKTFFRAFLHSLKLGKKLDGI